MDSIKPGQTIRCTIVKNLRPGDAHDTVMRLMRFDPDIKRSLKKAQERRMRTLVVRSRGGRPFEMYTHPSKIAKAEKGASWTMAYFPHVAPDIRSVGPLLKIEVA